MEVKVSKVYNAEDIMNDLRSNCKGNAKVFMSEENIKIAADVIEKLISENKILKEKINAILMEKARNLGNEVKEEKQKGKNSLCNKCKHNDEECKIKNPYNCGYVTWNNGEITECSFFEEKTMCDDCVYDYKKDCNNVYFGNEIINDKVIKCGKFIEKQKVSEKELGIAITLGTLFGITEENVKHFLGIDEK